MAKVIEFLKSNWPFIVAIVYWTVQMVLHEMRFHLKSKPSDENKKFTKEEIKKADGLKSYEELERFADDQSRRNRETP